MFWFFIAKIVTLPPHKLLLTLRFIFTRKVFCQRPPHSSRNSLEFQKLNNALRSCSPTLRPDQLSPYRLGSLKSLKTGPKRREDILRMIKIFPTAESVVASFIGTFWPAFHHCLHANIVPQKYNEGCTTGNTHLRYISSRLQNLDIQEHWHFNPYLHLSTFYFCVYLYNTVWIQFGYFQCSALLMRLSVRPSAFSNKTIIWSYNTEQ